MHGSGANLATLARSGRSAATRGTSLCWFENDSIEITVQPAAVPAGGQPFYAKTVLPSSSHPVRSLHERAAGSRKHVPWRWPRWWLAATTPWMRPRLDIGVRARGRAAVRDGNQYGRFWITSSPPDLHSVSVYFL